MLTFLKTLSAIIVAALIAGALTGFPGIEDAQATDTSQLARQVVRAPMPAPSVSQSATLIDTADRGWPYRNAANVRLIALDKVK